MPQDLPRAEAPAFSLDDGGTTEIDDAFSLRRLPGGELRIGIHIAAPALAIAPGSALDAIARERLSTAYMPGRKFTMLPEDVIERLSLDAGGERVAVSLYFDAVEGEPGVVVRHTRLERVPIAGNLRHAQYDALNQAFEPGGSVGLPHEDDLRSLWRVAEGAEAKRGRPSTGAATLTTTSALKATSPRPAAPARRAARQAGLRTDDLRQLELGRIACERDVAWRSTARNRSARSGLSVHPSRTRAGGVLLCVDELPLRRYVDLVNQWQLVAAIGGARAPFSRNSEGLLTALRAFEVTYARYDEHQRTMEDYWCLRWLLQERLASTDAVVLRDNLVRLEGLPLVARVASLPDLGVGVRVRLEIKGVDLLDRSIALVFREALGAG